MTMEETYSNSCPICRAPTKGERRLYEGSPSYPNVHMKHGDVLEDTEVCPRECYYRRDYGKEHMRLVGDHKWEWYGKNDGMEREILEEIARRRAIFQTMPPEQVAFLDAIAANRMDGTTLSVYADWLEERGLDEEAWQQRRWTPKYQEDEDWLRWYASQCRVPYSLLIQSARDFQEGPKDDVEGDSEGIGLYLLGYDVPKVAWGAEFWSRYERVVGREARYRNRFVSCSC